MSEPMELLFTYGTLQLEHVQLALFGRRLDGTRDALAGYREGRIELGDPGAGPTGGRPRYAIVRHTGDAEDTVAGVAYEVTARELERADRYETDAYARVRATLASGREAWVYVDARQARARDRGAARRPRSSP